MPGKKILVVDDEADVSTYLSALLTDAGYSVSTAANGLLALEHVKTDRPDLVTLDVSMPEKSGVGFYREMRKSPDLRDVPIVVVTGVSNPLESSTGKGGMKQFLASRKELTPPEGFFEKPIDRDEFLEKIAELLA